jgi:hypothetical protein
MATNEPIVLELAPLPREQTGPFLLLGVDKDADAEKIEANWAQRVIWARKGQTKVPLQDINWAREAINDPDRRVRADASSLNIDTIHRDLETLAARYGLAAGSGRAWEPVDVEKPLADYAPPADIPDTAEVLGSIVVPELPFEVPAAERLLEELAAELIDPWKI